MGLRYTSGFQGYNAYTRQYNDIELEIDDINFSGEPIDLTMGGSPLELTYTPINLTDKLSTLISSAIDFQLIANDSFQYNYIYTDKERALKVTVKVDGSVFGYYFIEPSGAREMFIDFPYTVSVRAIDGLGMLKNFDYTGASGKASVLQVIQKCLDKLKLGLNINCFSDIEYDGMPSGNNPYYVTYINQERFVHENGEPFKCDEVIESLLKEWVSGLVQMNGEWYLFRYPDIIKKDGDIPFFRYDQYLNSMGTNVVSTDLLLGNRSGDVIHCDYNQMISTEFPYKRVSIKYKYGFFREILNTSERFLAGSPLSGNFFEWDKVGGIDATPASLLPGSYAEISGRSDGAGGYDKYIKLTNPIPIAEENTMELSIVSRGFVGDGLRYSIFYTAPGGNLYYYAEEDAWVPYAVNFFPNFKQWDSSGTKTMGLGTTVKDTVKFTLPPYQANSFLNVFIYPSYFFPINVGYGTNSGTLWLYEISLKAVSSQDRIISETHTVTNNADYTKVPNTIEVFTGESRLDPGSNFSGYLGTMFEIDDSVTNGWRRKEDINYIPFLRLAAQDIITQHSKPMRKYEGSVLGFIPFLSRVAIDGLESVFIPTQMRFDFMEFKTELTLMEAGLVPVPMASAVEYEFEKATESGTVKVL